MVENGKVKMRKITLSLTDETEERLRDLSEQPPYNGIKGALSMITEQALKEYFEKLRKEE